MAESSTTADEPVVVELRSQRGVWLVFSTALGIPGLFMAGLAVGTLLSDDFGLAERIFGVGVLILGGLLLEGARRGWGVVQASARLSIASDGFTVEHAGLLRRPLSVPRTAVEEVAVDGLADPSSQRPLVAASTEILPDFSIPIDWHTRQSNVLIVFRSGFALGDTPRRGLGAVAFAADRFSSYSGPVRNAVINGMLCEAVDAAKAAQVFADWGVLVKEPSSSALARVGVAEARRRFGLEVSDGPRRKRFPSSGGNTDG